jgi:hypothetical protein
MKPVLRPPRLLRSPAATFVVDTRDDDGQSGTVAAEDFVADPGAGLPVAPVGQEDVGSGLLAAGRAQASQVEEVGENLAERGDG